MKCPIHGIEKTMRIVDDKDARESYPSYSCHKCHDELMAEIKAFQKKVAEGLSPEELAARRAS